jgi:hypothetical protein
VGVADTTFNLCAVLGTFRCRQVLARSVTVSVAAVKSGGGFQPMGSTRGGHTSCSSFTPVRNIIPSLAMSTARIQMR